jgi:hypothetical protein
MIEFCRYLWLIAISALSLGVIPTVDSGSLVELVDEDGRRIDRFEASGLAYFEDRLLVVDDTLNFVFVFNRDGKMLQRIEPARFPKLRAKFEDLAFDPSTGTFFAVGSHEGWDQATLENLSVLLHFRVVEQEGMLTVEDSSVENLPLNKSFELLGLWKPEGMKIEGLAYDSENDHLYIGLREPRDRARVYRVTSQSLFEAKTGGTIPYPEEVLSFDPGKVDGTPFHISALLWLPETRGLLVATSTEDDETHQFLGNRIWHFSTSRGLRLLRDTFDQGMKAEGLALGEDHLYICYDNDQDDTGIPSRLRIIPFERLLLEESKDL